MFLSRKLHNDRGFVKAEILSSLMEKVAQAGGTQLTEENEILVFYCILMSMWHLKEYLSLKWL